jgi:hypothetical protein
MNYFKESILSSLEAKTKAQYIAFAPIVFQATRSLVNLGILGAIEDSGIKGVSIKDISKKLDLSEYAVRVLVEAGLAIGLLIIQNENYIITKIGYYFLHDDLTKANVDFVNDICYQGMYNLEDSLRNSKPEGLRKFGDWKTVYEGLVNLPEKAQKSWFTFDHYYSDISFNQILPFIFKYSPSKILDIGGNTGKMALKCLIYSDSVEIGIVDLPGLLTRTKKNLDEAGFKNRFKLFGSNILDDSTQLPEGYDIIWMSQFLDCFSEDQIKLILKKCCDALNEQSFIFIIEPFWDLQKYEVSAFCIMMTSLYFTNIANGNSQMLRYDLFEKLLIQAGLNIVVKLDNIAVSNSLLICKKNQAYEQKEQ